MRRSRSVPWLVIGLIAVAVNLWLDRVAPNQYSFEIFYVVPIVFVTLRGGRTVGAIIAVAAAISWSIDTMQEESYELATMGWDLGTRAVTFVGLAILLDLYQRRGTRLTRLDRHREDSFALVAHKLRETATRITSVTGAIAARDVDGIITEARIALDHQARELRRMAEDVLDVNILEAKRFRLNLSDVDLTELVTDVAREIGRGQVQLVTQAEPVLIEADADRLRLMVTHLIGNAVKYSPPGAPIFVTISSGHAEARIVVKDHGVGLGSSDVSLLFQKYGQAHTAKTTGTQGVGLGLYVTRLIAEAHGGTVTAESIGPGQGSTFQLSLPVRQPKGAAS